MAKRVKGHRANKANDSFGLGTVNNDTLYRGKYREEVYNEDDDEAEEAVEAQQADPEEATPQESTSFVEQKQETDHDYKKRYDDLKRHYDSKVNEFKGEIEALRRTMTERAAEMPRGVTPPRTLEELEEFKERYPDVFEVVQTVSSMQTETQVAKLREEIGTIKERERELEKQKAYEELLRLHPDFEDIRDQDEFHEWVETQPKWVQTALYDNEDDALSAARAIDLYKADNGLLKKKESKVDTRKQAASSVTTKSQKSTPREGGEDGAFYESQVQKMTAAEYEKNADSIMEAIRTGNFVYDLSGGAR